MREGSELGEGIGLVPRQPERVRKRLAPRSIGWPQVRCPFRSLQRTRRVAEMDQAARQRELRIEVPRLQANRPTRGFDPLGRVGSPRSARPPRPRSRPPAAGPASEARVPAAASRCSPRWDRISANSLAIAHLVGVAGPRPGMAPASRGGRGSAARARPGAASSPGRAAMLVAAATSCPGSSASGRSTRHQLADPARQGVERHAPWVIESRSRWWLRRRSALTSRVTQYGVPISSRRR
jgi:hypothetical protein